MLPKTPKSIKRTYWKFVKSSAKVLFVVEVFLFAGSYGVYHRMNTNREFRRYVNENYPFVLDYYYKVGEVIGNSNLRQIDAARWRSEETKSE